MGVWIFLPAFLCPLPTDRSGGWALVERSSPLAVLLEAGSAKSQNNTKLAVDCVQTGKRMYGVNDHSPLV